jgi:hypothetical protein
MAFLERGWLSLALGFAALFIGYQIGTDLTHHFMMTQSSVPASTAAAA